MICREELHGKSDFMELVKDMEHRTFKKELTFSVIWIVIYFILIILANVLSDYVVKIPNSVNAFVEILFPTVVIVYLKKKGLLSYYGINSLKHLNFKNLLFCVPMIVIAVLNLGFGIHINYSRQQLLLFSAAMLGMGFSEEILFRSFLIKALMNKNTKIAVFAPSIIFGVIHLTNLFGGANLIQTLLQVIYAVSFALMCSLFFIKTNNIIPCMICHSITNITNSFLPDDLSIAYQCIKCIAFIIPSAFYALFIYKTNKALTKNIS